MTVLTFSGAVNKEIELQAGTVLHTTCGNVIVEQILETMNSRVGSVKKDSPLEVPCSGKYLLTNVGNCKSCTVETSCTGCGMDEEDRGLQAMWS